MLTERSGGRYTRMIMARSLEKEFKDVLEKP
jgi:hypothetical protein